MTEMVCKTACRHLEECQQKIVSHSFNYYCMSKAHGWDQDSCFANNDVESEDNEVGVQGPHKTPKKWFEFCYPKSTLKDWQGKVQPT